MKHAIYTSAPGVYDYHCTSPLKSPPATFRGAPLRKAEIEGSENVFKNQIKRYKRAGYVALTQVEYDEGTDIEEYTT